MTTTSSFMSADALVELHDKIAAIPHLLSGALDARISELKVLKQELATHGEIAATMAEAEKIKTEAMTYAARIVAEAQAKADSTKEAANALATSAAATLDAANQKAVATADLNASLLQWQRKLDNDVESSEQVKKDLAAWQDQLTALSNDLTARETKLKGDQSMLNARLEALKVPI